MEPFHIHRVSARPLARGFTLIELMVVLAIIVVITSVVFTNQNSFNKTLILSNTAYDIALTLRSTQTYGLSSRAAGTSANVGYGIHLSLSNTVYNSFIVFADTAPVGTSGPGGTLFCSGALSAEAPDCKPGDGIYTSDGSEPDALSAVQTYNLNNGIKVSDFCAYPAVGSGSCASGSLTALDIVFTRPNPNAIINGSNGASYTTYSRACITISSQDNTNNRYISIAASGQIIANASPCSP